MVSRQMLQGFGACPATSAIATRLANLGGSGRQSSSTTATGTRDLLVSGSLEWDFKGLANVSREKPSLTLHSSLLFPRKWNWFKKDHGYEG
jgi:hypothetical protein